MKYEIETEFIEANGLCFEVLTCGEGDRLALCLHGFPEVALSWREQMVALAGLGYRVWAPNQRGYGRSSRPAAMQDYAIEHLMADVAGLIDAAHRSHGVHEGTYEGAREVVLLGHDWGGVVAWCFANRRLRPLTKLVVINAPHPMCFIRAVRRPGQMLRSWYMLLFQVPGLAERLLGRNGAQAIETAMVRSSSLSSSASSSSSSSAASSAQLQGMPRGFPVDLLEASRANAAQPGALRAMLNWYRAFLRGGGMRRQWQLGFGTIETPTLLLWGEADRFLARYTTDGTDRFVQDLTIEFLPGVSHWVQQDAPEMCNAALVRFLSSV